MKHLNQQVLFGTVSTLVILCVSVYGYLILTYEPEWSFETNPYIVIDDEKTIKGIMIEGSFREIPEIEGTWTPHVNDILKLEHELPSLNNMDFDSINGISKLALPVKEYYRQYLGVKYKGEKIIYINALSYNKYIPWSLNQLKLRGKDNQLRSSHCGNYCWGGLFNPKELIFSELKVDIE